MRHRYQSVRNCSICFGARPLSLFLVKSLTSFTARPIIGRCCYCCYYHCLYHYDVHKFAYFCFSQDFDLNGVKVPLSSCTKTACPRSIPRSSTSSCLSTPCTESGNHNELESEPQSQTTPRRSPWSNHPCTPCTESGNHNALTSEPQPETTPRRSPRKRPKSSHTPSPASQKRVPEKRYVHLAGHSGRFVHHGGGGGGGVVEQFLVEKTNKLQKGKVRK